MKFWQRYWYYIGGVAFVILTFAMGLGGSAALDYVQVLLIFSWMGMLVHQFEEYAWPGGFPLISNMIVFNEIERPDRYILNQRQCFVSNVVLCYLCYIVPIFFPAAHLACRGSDIPGSLADSGAWHRAQHALEVRLQSWSFRGRVPAAARRYRVHMVRADVHAGSR